MILAQALAPASRGSSLIKSWKVQLDSLCGWRSQCGRIGSHGLNLYKALLSDKWTDLLD